ncbi:MAG: hypothetical protein OSA23_00470 [Rhodospirillales bacterium]|nr:hypothetical protein [Rhodospirillales bacterium]
MHKRIYTTVMILIIISQIIWPTTWWFFWPLLIWSVLFTLHIMVMRTIDIDDAWVEERSNKIADNALDLSQVEAIRKQVSRTTYGEAYDLEGDKNTQKKK